MFSLVALHSVDFLALEDLPTENICSVDQVTTAVNGVSFSVQKNGAVFHFLD